GFGRAGAHVLVRPVLEVRLRAREPHRRRDGGLASLVGDGEVPGRPELHLGDGSTGIAATARILVRWTDDAVEVHRGHTGDHVSCLTRDLVRHAAAVRAARGIDASEVDAGLRLELSDDGPGEGNVVDVLVQRGFAAAPDVPGVADTVG